MIYHYFSGGSMAAAACRDCEGATWTGEVGIADADKDRCGGAWLGNGLGALYSRAGEAYWISSPNPEDWSASVELDTGIAGHVTGLCMAEPGVLAGLLEGAVIVSRNRGETWEAAGALPLAASAAKYRQIFALRHRIYVVYMTDTDLAQTYSEDGGASWR